METMREKAVQARYDLWDNLISMPFCNDPEGCREEDVIQAAESFADALEAGKVDINSYDRFEQKVIRRTFDIKR